MKCRMNLACAVAVLLLAAWPALGRVRPNPRLIFLKPALPNNYFPTQLVVSTGSPLTKLLWCADDSWAKTYQTGYPSLYQPFPAPAPDDKRVKEQLIRVEAELGANAFPSVEKALTVLRARKNELFEGKSYAVVAPPAEKTDKATLTLKNLSKSQQINVVLTFFNGKGEIVKQEIPKFQASADFHMAMLAVNQEIQVPYNCANTWVVVEWTAGPGLMNITVPFQTIADAKTETKGKK